MCRDCGCSLGPAATRAPLAAPAGVAGKIETIEVITAILGENDRVAAHNREHFDGHGVLALNLMSSPGRRQDRAARGDDPRARRAPADRGDRGRPRDGERRRAHPRLRRAGGADHHRQRLPPRRAHGARRPARPAARRPRRAVHRERRQPRLPGELRPRPAPQRHAAVGDRRRRQAGQVPGHVPRGRPAADHEDGPARRTSTSSPRARARLAARRSRYAGETIELTSRGGEGFDAWLAWLEREVAAQRSAHAPRRDGRGRRCSPRARTRTPPEGGPPLRRAT